jgi:hypothetical protein
LNGSIPSSLGKLTSLTSLRLNDNLLEGPTPELSPSLVYCYLSNNAGLCALDGISDLCTVGLEICPVYSSITSLLSSALTSVIEASVHNSSSSNYAISKTSDITPPTTITSTKELISTRESTRSLTLIVGESRFKTTSANLNTTPSATIEAPSTDETISTSEIMTSQTVRETELLSASTKSADISSTPSASVEETSNEEMISTIKIETPHTAGETVTVRRMTSSDTAEEETSAEEMISTGEITTPQTFGKSSTELSSGETTSTALSSSTQDTTEESNTMSTSSSFEMTTSETNIGETSNKSTSASIASFASKTDISFSLAAIQSPFSPTSSTNSAESSTFIKSYVFTTTSSGVQPTPTEYPNVPIIQNVAVIESLEYSALPPDCFSGIESRCEESNETTQFSCSNNEISEALVNEVLDDISHKLVGFLTGSLSLETGNSSITHNSTCKNSTESSWIEVFKVASDQGVVVIQLSPTFYAASFLQLNVNSFGTSSVQFACYYENGDAQEFSTIVGGIIAGYTISGSQYDCKQFSTTAEENSTDIASNSTSTALVKNVYYDLPDEIGLPLEYTIVLIYIVLSYLAAFKAYKLHMQQRTRTDFKTNVNLSFVILFLVWATGNLLYLVLYSVFLTASNFFYIKMVLTLTYFLTYLGFALIVHYRYELGDPNYL